MNINIDYSIKNAAKQKAIGSPYMSPLDKDNRKNSEPINPQN